MNASDRKVQDENEPLSELVKKLGHLQKYIFFYRKIVVLEGKTRKIFCSINSFLFFVDFLHYLTRVSFLSCTFPSLTFILLHEFFTNDIYCLLLFFTRHLLLRLIVYSILSSFFPYQRKNIKKKPVKQ